MSENTPEVRPEPMPAPPDSKTKEGAKSKERLGQGREGVQAALLADGLVPGREKLTQENLQEIVNKVNNGQPLDAQNSSNASNMRSHDYWNGHDAEFDDKSIEDKDKIHQADVKEWVENTNNVFKQIKDKPEAIIFRRLGINMDGGPEAVKAFYKEYFAEQKDKVGYLEGKIAGSGLTQEEVKKALEKIKIKIMVRAIDQQGKEITDPDTGRFKLEEKEVDISALEILGGFYSQSKTEITDRVEGILNFRDDPEGTSSEALRQFENIGGEDKKLLESIHDDSGRWKAKEKIWEEKQQEEIAVRERLRKEAEDAEKAAAADREKSMKEGRLTNEDLEKEIERLKKLRGDDGNLRYTDEQIENLQVAKEDDPGSKLLRDKYEAGEKIVFSVDNNSYEGVVEEIKEEEAKPDDKKRMVIRTAEGQIINIIDLLKSGGEIKRKIEDSTKPDAAGGGNKADNEIRAQIEHYKNVLYEFARNNKNQQGDWVKAINEKSSEVERNLGIQKITFEGGKILVPLKDDPTKFVSYELASGGVPYKIDKVKDVQVNDKQEAVAHVVHDDIIVVDVGLYKNAEAFKRYLDEQYFFERLSSPDPIQIVQVGNPRGGGPEVQEIMHILFGLKQTSPKSISFNI